MNIRHARPGDLERVVAIYNQTSTFPAATDQRRNWFHERDPGRRPLWVAEVDQIRRTAQSPVSLEKPVGDDEESEFGHFLRDETLPLPEEAAETSLRKETLLKILGALSPRERRVLELRYGLGGEHPRTLDEVGRTFNVTRERIRQIENQSLKKLQSLAEAQKLRDVA